MEIPLINTNGDNEMQIVEAKSFYGQINCGMMNISDLTGIEEFTALTYLDCAYNSHKQDGCVIQKTFNVVK